MLDSTMIVAMAIAAARWFSPRSFTAWVTMRAHDIRYASRWPAILLRS